MVTTLRTLLDRGPTRRGTPAAPGGVEAALRRDATLSSRQKQVLLEVYGAFREPAPSTPAARAGVTGTEPVDLRAAARAHVC